MSQSLRSNKSAPIQVEAGEGAQGFLPPRPPVGAAGGPLAAAAAQHPLANTASRNISQNDNNHPDPWPPLFEAGGRVAERQRLGDRAASWRLPAQQLLGPSRVELPTGDPTGNPGGVQMPTRQPEGNAASVQQQPTNSVVPAAARDGGRLQERNDFFSFPCFQLEFTRQKAQFVVFLRILTAYMRVHADPARFTTLKEAIYRFDIVNRSQVLHQGNVPLGLALLELHDEAKQIASVREWSTARGHFRRMLWRRRHRTVRRTQPTVIPPDQD